jgi:PAS domain-containing protein
MRSSSTIPPFWTRAAGVVALSAGTLSLGGWALAIPKLAGAVRGLPPLSPLTALALALAGGALLLLARPRTSWARYAGGTLAVLCALTGVAGFLMQASPVPPESAAAAVATWWGHPRVLLHLPPSVATATALLGLGLALLAMTVRTAEAARVAQGVALAPLLVALFTTAPLVNPDVSLWAERHSMAMPPHSAFLVLLLAVGVVLSQPERGAPWGLPLQGGATRLLRSLLPPVLLVAPVFVWLGAAFVRPDHSGADLRRTLIVVAEVAALGAFAVAIVQRAHRRETIARRQQTERRRGTRRGSGGGERVADRAERMEAHRRQLHHILRVLPAPFIVLDGHGSIGFANPEAERFFRRPTGGLVGLRLRDMLGADSWARVARVIDEVRGTGEHVSVTAEMGSARTVELRAFPADDGVALFVRELPGPPALEDPTARRERRS